MVDHPNVLNMLERLYRSVRLEWFKLFVFEVLLVFLSYYLMWHPKYLSNSQLPLIEHFGRQLGCMLKVA